MNEKMRHAEQSLIESMVIKVHNEGIATELNSSALLGYWGSLYLPLLCRPPGNVRHQVLSRLGLPRP